MEIGDGAFCPFRCRGTSSSKTKNSHESAWNLNGAGAAVALAFGAAPAQAAIIAYNFSENPGNQVLDTVTPKGPTGTSIWNDSNVVDNGGLSAGDEANLVDDSGATTSATIAWSSSGAWWNGSGTGSEEAKIAVGYLDDGGSGVSVGVTGIPFANYNVYGIVGSDQTLTTYTSLDFNVNGTWVFGGASASTATAFSDWSDDSANGVWTEIDPGVTTGNYWKMEGLSGDLTIQGQLRNGAERGSLAAIIIEEVPEPSVVFLGTLGLLPLLRRRRG